MLEVQNLRFSYRSRVLFDGLSFAVADGSVLHLGGPNGAGKTTLVKIIAGLLTADDGTVTLKNKGVEEEDRRVGLEYLPAEANGLYGKLNAPDNLAFWAKLRGLALDGSQIHEALKAWGLGHPMLAGAFPTERFSTGMRRRLALARFSLSVAPFWLLDEPLYGLDAEATHAFRALLLRHVQRGGAALIVSHEPAALSTVADYLKQLHLGDQR